MTPNEKGKPLKDFCIIDEALELELELYSYLDTVNLSDKIILLQSIITTTIYFNLYKHDLKFKSETEKIKKFCFT